MLANATQTLQDAHEDSSTTNLLHKAEQDADDPFSDLAAFHLKQAEQRQEHLLQRGDDAGRSQRLAKRGGATPSRKRDAQRKYASELTRQFAEGSSEYLKEVGATDQCFLVTMMKNVLNKDNFTIRYALYVLFCVATI